MSLPKKIAEELRQELGCRFKAGHKLPGMHDLRRRFGVSINTIGAALDILAGEGLLQKRRGSGVYVAERAGRLRIGILSELNLLDSRIGYSFQATAEALRLQLKDQGMEPILYVGHAEPGAGVSDDPTCPGFWDDAKAGRLDGAVILNVPSTNEWFCRMASCPVPAVGTMTPFSFELDQSRMTDMAIRRLAAQGCRRIGLISWHGEKPFRKAVKVCGLQTCDDWIRSNHDPAVRGAGWDEFREIWAARVGRPDGLVILDDMLFADAQLAILELGVRIPQELQIVVQTNRNASPALRLPVTALEVDPAERAAALADMIVKRLNGELSAPTMRYASFREIPTATAGSKNL